VRAGDAGAALLAGLLGLAFERVIIKPVYGQHLKQILITTGGMIVAEQLIHVFWGPDLIPLPAADDAARLFPDRRHGDREIPPDRGGRRPRVFAAMLLLLNRTKIGLLIAPASRTRRWSRRWATASGACSSACSSPARRWRASAARSGACTRRA
jgi:branched-chain amino acid transport system permease protein